MLMQPFAAKALSIKQPLEKKYGQIVINIHKQMHIASIFTNLTKNIECWVSFKIVTDFL